MKTSFQCEPHIVGRMDSFGDKQVTAEPMFFSSHAEYLLQHGGPVTQNFVESLPREWQNRLNEVIIDSRWHILRLGMFPAIPGWHHDDVPRKGPNGQPNYVDPEYFSRHIAAIIGDSSRTRFLTGRVDVPEVADDEIVYKKWNAAIERLLYSNRVMVRSVDTRDLTHFTADDFHEGTQATHNGARAFFRASIDTPRKFFDEKRVQVQAYYSKPPQTGVSFNGPTAVPQELTDMPSFDQETLRHERMLTGDVAFAKKEGGPVTRAFINQLPQDWQSDPTVMIDTTTYMFMPGWNPTLPGDEMHEVTLRPIDPDAACDPAGAECIFAVTGNSAPLSHLAGNFNDTFGRAIRTGFTATDKELLALGEAQKTALTSLPARKLISTNGGILLVSPSTENAWQVVCRATRVNDPRQIGNRIRHQTQMNLPKSELYSGW